MSILTPEQVAAFSVERKVATRSRQNLVFLDNLKDLALLNGGKVGAARACSVNLLLPQEVAGVQKDHARVTAGRMISKLSEVRHSRTTSLGDFIPVKIGEVGLHTLVDGKKVLGASLQDDSSTLQQEQLRIVDMAGELAGDPIELEPHASFLWLATVYREGDALDKMIDYASDRLPDTVDLFDVRVFDANRGHFAGPTPLNCV